MWQVGPLWIGDGRIGDGRWAATFRELVRHCNARNHRYIETDAEWVWWVRKYADVRQAPFNGNWAHLHAKMYEAYGSPERLALARERKDDWEQRLITRLQPWVSVEEFRRLVEQWWHLAEPQTPRTERP